MTFRPYLLLTLLAFAAHGAGQAPSGAAPDPAPLVPPDYWQSSDWQGIPDSTRVDKQQVLFAKHDSDNYVGLVILLPDWQRSGPATALERHTVIQKWRTCTPCLSKRCPYPEPPCMDLISVDEVEAACRQRLEQPA